MKKCIYSFILSSFLVLPSYAQDVVTSSVQDVTNVNPQSVKAPSMFDAMLQMLPLCIIIYFIFYFFVTRPQEQMNKKKKEMIDSLKVGDQVKTSCGIYGRVSSVEEKFVFLEVSQGVKVKFSKNALVEKM